MEKRTRKSSSRDAKPGRLRHKRRSDQQVISILTVRLSASLRQHKAETLNAPTLLTKDLALKSVTSHLPKQPDWLNDKDNVKYSEQRGLKHTPVSCQKYIRGCTHFWGIKEVASDQWVGTISVHVDEPNRVADIGILIDHTFGKNGYGLQAWVAVQDWLLENNIRKVTGGCMACNEPMVKIFNKAGMKFEGERKGQVLKDGQPMNIVYYARWK